MVEILGKQFWCIFAFCGLVVEIQPLDCYNYYLWFSGCRSSHFTATFSYLFGSPNPKSTKSNSLRSPPTRLDSTRLRSARSDRSEALVSALPSATTPAPAIAGDLRQRLEAVGPCGRSDAGATSGRWRVREFGEPPSPKSRTHEWGSFFLGVPTYKSSRRGRSALEKGPHPHVVSRVNGFSDVLVSLQTSCRKARHVHESMRFMHLAVVLDPVAAGPKGSFDHGTHVQLIKSCCRPLCAIVSGSFGSFCQMLGPQLFAN